MLSIPFYIFYSFLAYVGPFFIFSKRFKIFSFLSLIICSQFNVTSFFKFGVTFSFFEINLCLFLILVLLTQDSLFRKIFIFKIDMIVLIFLIISILSIIISQFRLYFGDLVPFSINNEIPFIRSLMSLNKIIFYVPLLIIVRAYLIKNFEMSFIKHYFFLGLVLAGILPSIAVIIQFFSLDFFIIKNNISFAENFRVINFIDGDRPLGLTNEASFFSYQLFFSFISLIQLYKFKSISKKYFYSLILLFIISLVLSLSRTGILLFIIYGFYNLLNNKISFKVIFKVIFSIFVFLFILQNLNISGFNILDRLSSSFNFEADLSTLERYGSAHAIFNLLIDKSLVFGVGIFNYGFYIQNYLPNYMNLSDFSDRAYNIPSFNFILQLIAEFGIPLFLLFFISTVRYVLKVKDSFISSWFLFLLIFCFTFQALNFSIPFLIYLYPLSNEKNTLYN